MNIDLNKPIHLEDYIQTRTPDKAELARLLQEAKGKDRVMATFAKECGSSPSTFSRIANCKITQPLEPLLLKAIADNYAGASYAQRNYMLLSLLHANGMVDQAFVDRKKSMTPWDGFFESDEEMFSEENEAKNIITMNLLNRGYGIKYLASIKKSAGVSDYSRGFGRSEFVIQIDGHEPEYHLFRVECLNKSIKARIAGAEDHVDEETGYDYASEARSLLKDLAIYFLIDIWESESLEKVKTSYVFTDRKYYEAFCTLLQNRATNAWVSLILVDLKDQIVVEERYIQRNDCRTQASLFDAPAISHMDDEKVDEEEMDAED